MARDHDGSAGTVLMTFMLGAISGAAVALLWSPSTGDEVRRVLTEKAREGTTKAGTAAREGREFVRRRRETVTTAIDRGREAYKQARNKEQEKS